jgi:nitroreductase
MTDNEAIAGEYTLADQNAITALLRARRTVHDFVAEPPPGGLIEEAIEVARWAPNHYRTEPWHFYVLNRASAERISALNAELVAAARGPKVASVKLKRWRTMPGWLVVTCVTSDDPIRSREDYAACCCAVQNLMLFLWARGVGVKWTTGEVTRESGFFDIVGIDRDRETVVGLFWYGFPATVPEQRRKGLDEIVSHVGS